MKPTVIIEAIVRHADSDTADLTEKNEADILKEISLVKRNVNSNKYIESKFGENLEDIVILLMRKYNIPEKFELEFRGNLISCAREFHDRVVRDGLPVKPTREYQPREGILEYIRASDGLGPWLEAGVLTRPMLKELSPTGYMALANWLRNKSNSLESEGLSIPTKSEANALLRSDPLTLKEAHRIASSAYYARHRERRRAHKARTREPA